LTFHVTARKDNGGAIDVYAPPPGKYFDKKAISKKSKVLHATLDEACNKLKKFENDNETTHRLVLAQVRMAVDEVSQIISNQQKTSSQAIVDSLTMGVPLPPHTPMKTKGQIKKANQVNNSRLV
jgi:hypothetical protein